MTLKSFLYVVLAGWFTTSDSFKAFCDCPEKNQVFVQDPATPMMEGMIYFHNLLMFIIVFVSISCIPIIVNHLSLVRTFDFS